MRESGLAENVKLIFLLSAKKEVHKYCRLVYAFRLFVGLRSNHTGKPKKLCAKMSI